MTRFCVGTAQWGLDYGVTNTHGRLSDSSMSQLLGSMRNSGIDCLDTAANYGDSESRIGLMDTQGLRIQTKISGKTPSPFAAIKDSLSRLNRDTVASVLVHDWFELSPEQKDQCASELLAAQNNGLVSMIGVSAYGVADIQSAHEHFDALDIAQIPVNALDHTFVTAEIAIQFPHTHFQARSVFLQGLLATGDPMRVDHEALRSYQEFVRAHDSNHLIAALGFIVSQTWLDSVVIAPTTITELKEIEAAWSAAQDECLDWDYSSLMCTDPKLMDPRTWN